MKRYRFGIILLIIGVIIVVMAPIWKWAIAPSFLKLPCDIDITPVYEGTLKLYVNQEAMTLLPEGKEKIIPIKITRKEKGVPGISDSNTVIVKESVVTTSGGTIISKFENYYALDRKTSKNVPSHKSNRNRKGYSILLPVGTKKSTYEMWDDDTETTTKAKFVKELTRDGNKHKRVKLYLFSGKSEATFVKPPIGLPEKLTGKQIKEIIGKPNLALADNELFPITYLKKINAEFSVEPRTGSIVDVPKYSEVYLVDASTLGMEPIKLASIDYSQTDESVRECIDDSAKYFSMLDIVTLWIPLIFLVIGLLVLLFSSVVYARKPASQIEVKQE